MLDYSKLLATCYRLHRYPRRAVESVQRYQMARFKQLVHHAYARVPMYREYYDACHFHPSTLSNSYEEMERVPIITKEIIRHFPVSQRMDTQATGKKFIKETTSGSTGQPFEVWSDQTQGFIQTLKCIRFLYAWGYSMFDHTVQLWGDVRQLKTSPIQKLGLFKRQLIPIQDGIKKNLERLEKMHCDVLSSTRSTLELLADALETSQCVFSPRLLVSEGEIITDAQRRRFRTVFGCRTIEIYGCVETGNIAWECPECGNLHIEMETVVVNFKNIRKNSDGKKTGTVVVTNLENDIMPFIRYDLGDLVVLPEKLQCSCGRTLPVMGRVEGRNEDVVAYNGEKFTWHYFYSYFKDYSYIRQYKIIQVDTGRIRFVINLFNNSKAQQNDCARHLNSIFGPVFPGLEIRFVDRFPSTPGKKVTVIEKRKAGKARSDPEKVWDDRSL